MPKTDSSLKYQAAAELIRVRVGSGAYALRGMPGERRLAGELGVSYVTVRRAVEELVAAGSLRRLANGRLAPGPASPAATGPVVAWIIPALPDAASMAWGMALADLLAERGGRLLTVPYLDASDPALFAALEGPGDGALLILPPDAPPLLLDQVARLRERVVVLWEDLSDRGVLSLEASPPEEARLVLDHLAGLGHRRIDACAPVPHGGVIGARLAAWRAWCARTGCAGECIPAPTAGHPDARSAGHAALSAALAGGWRGSALFCTGIELACGAMRACQDAGRPPGRAVAVAAFGGAELARLSIPTVTTVVPPPRRDCLAIGLDWLAARGRGWRRPLRIEMEGSHLYIGESTMPGSPLP